MAGLEKHQSISDIRIQLYILGLFRFTEALAWTSIFPYVYFMIGSFDSVNDTDVALYAGVLISVFTFCEFLSGMLWARIADTIGRKPTLLIGIIGGIASAALFGFSRNLMQAIAARAIGGLLNPNVGVVQTCIGELATRKEQQANAFSVVPYLRGLGNLVGPIIGGFLADPVKHYPSSFKASSIWAEYPYLLPNLVVVCLLVVTFVIGFLFFRETLPRTEADASVASTMAARFGKLFTWLGLRHQQSGYRHITDPESLPPTELTIQSPTDDDAQDAVELKSLNRQNFDRRDAQDAFALEPLDQEAADHQDALTATERETRGKIYTTQVILQIISVSLLAFHKVASDIIMPVFLASPNRTTSHIPEHIKARNFLQFDDGFGLSTRQIGPILLSQALIAVIGQFFLVPRIVGTYGALRIYRYVLWLYPFFYLFTPFTAQLPYPVSVATVMVDLWVKVLLSSTGYTCSAILITNTSPSKAYLARINGAAASFGCLARSVGPLVAGRLFGWGLHMHYIGVAFWALSGVAAFGAVECLILHDHP